MISRDLASFLQEGLGIYVGTRNAALEPNGARACAAIVEPDGVHVTVFVPSVAASRVLPDIAANGQIAISFGRPVDERACQVKGNVLDTRDAREPERAIVDAQWEGFLRNLETIGIPRAATRQWARWPAIAVRVKTTAVFEQTPGPAAGAPLS